MKNFNRENYVRDLEQQVWTDVNLSNNPNEMWAKLKNTLINCIDKDTPLRLKRVEKRNLPG